LLDALLPHARAGRPIVGLEPSCLLSLRDEIPALLPGKDADLVSRHAVLFEEFIAAKSRDADLPLDLKPAPYSLLVHGHCHQKSFGLMSDVERALGLLPEASVEMISAGCCGMAGSFGYGADTYKTSLEMAALELFPAIEAGDPEAVIVAAGTSCRHQIADGTGRVAYHPARLFADALVAQ
jgi:Fe-S oxidoreductase